MKILLIQPRMNWNQIYAEAPSNALLILGTLAKKKGHDVQIVHMDIDKLPSLKVDIVGITVNTFQVKSAREVAEGAKKVGARVIIGGPHAIAWDGVYDQIIIGEGENKWLEVLGEKPDIKSVDDIGMPDYSLVDLGRFTGISFVGAVPSMCVMASRGCPFNCIYCNTPVLWGKIHKTRNPQLIVDEVQHLHDKYGAREVFFQDDTFNLNGEWATEIFEEIIKRKLNQDMVFRVAFRVNEKLVSKELLSLAAKAGVWNIFYGIESGSQKMLDGMKKGITVPEIKRAIKMTHEAHINAECSFIFGLPGETGVTLRETAELIEEIKPSRFGFCPACPFPGTELDKIVTAKGHKLDTDYADYGYGMMLTRTDELNYQELTILWGKVQRIAIQN